MCEQVGYNFNSSFLNLTFLLEPDSDLNYSQSCPLATTADLTTLTLLSFLLEGVVQFIISSLGILGNTASIFLLTRRELQSFFNQLLMVLVVFDLVYLITMMLESIRKFGLESELHTLLLPHLLYPLNAISMMGSIYMTMVVGMERYRAVYHPMEYSRVANDASTHTDRLIKYVSPITLFAVVFNIPKFFESKVVYTEHDKNVYIEVTDLRMSTMYITWYHNWARFIVLGIIPFIAICYLNYKIYLVISERRKSGTRKQDDNLSVVLMMIVASFVACNLIRIFLNMHELTVIEEIQLCRCSDLGGFPVWIVILGFISHIFLVINSSTNLLIYCMFGTKFRKVLSSYINYRDSESAEEHFPLRTRNTKHNGK